MVHIFPPTPGIVVVFVVLAITQIIGWGSVGLVAIVGRDISAELGMDMPVVFAGSSLFYVTMGLCAPFMATAFTRFGARPVMIAGSVGSALGFLALSCAQDGISFFLAWLVLGAAGSMTLSTAAYIMLNEVAGRGAKSSIGGLMILTGLSSSIFWPATSLLNDDLGWRGTSLVYGGLIILVCLPLYLFVLPAKNRRREGGLAIAAPALTAATMHRGTFYLISTAIALNAFVTFGFSAILIELLLAQGLSSPQAVAFGSALGVIQVSARGLDLIGGGRWDGITTGLVAGLALPPAMLLLLAGQGSYWTIAGFILLYGLGSGALAVSRATIPLVFYDQAEFAKATSRIALPLNLFSAASPPLLVGLLTRYGSNAVLCLAISCSCGALLALLVLRRRRPTLLS